LAYQLSGLYQVVDHRLSVFRRLLGLTGRLDLVLAQVAQRQEVNPAAADVAPTIFYGAQHRPQSAAAPPHDMHGAYVCVSMSVCMCVAADAHTDVSEEEGGAAGSDGEMAADSEAGGDAMDAEEDEGEGDEEQEDEDEDEDEDA
jgi:hypothetical protein